MDSTSSACSASGVTLTGTGAMSKRGRPRRRVPLAKPRSVQLDVATDDALCLCSIREGVSINRIIGDAIRRHLRRRRRANSSSC